MNRLSDAVDQHRRLTSLFLSTVFSKGNYAHLPILFALLEDLADLSMAADKQSRLQGSPEESLQGSMQLFQSAVSACLGDRSNSLQFSKKKGALKVVNIQMKIFFEADQIALLSKLIETVNHRFPDNEIDVIFTKAELLTYRFFYARDCLLNDSYIDAETWFHFVLTNVPKQFYKNRRMVLLFYLPLRMAKGILPSTQLFENNPKLSVLYKPMVDAIKLGKISLLLTHLENTEINSYLRKYALYDLIDALRWLILRRVIRKTYLVLKKSTRMTLNFCHTALSMSFGSDFPMNQVESCLSTLIEMDLIRGYISHEHQTMVLSAQNPFPVIKDQLYNTFLLWDAWTKLP
ncbi:COP9 signalosome (CSN) subunit [Coelomomyces lativittatus]|nr:COP9 signalosome (CSN) subunit [Coelomomyces lativittatus]